MRAPLAHVVWCIVGILVALTLGYAAFYVFGVVMTGGSLGVFSASEVVGAFIYFMIPAVFIFVPPTVAGYICGLVLSMKLSGQERN
jgi:hypothetical protein